MEIELAKRTLGYGWKEDALPTGQVSGKVGAEITFSSEGELTVTGKATINVNPLNGSRYTGPLSPNGTKSGVQNNITLSSDGTLSVAYPEPRIDVSEGIKQGVLSLTSDPTDGLNDFKLTVGPFLVKLTWEPWQLPTDGSETYAFIPNFGLVLTAVNGQEIPGAADKAHVTADVYSGG